jgi:pyridoxamine 5'-phosphate oxidase
MPNLPLHVNGFQRKNVHLAARCATALLHGTAVDSACPPPGHGRRGKIHAASNTDKPMNLADIRKEYMRAGLAEADAARDPLVQFEHWMNDALRHELPMSNAMTLATVTAEGGPDARIVLLKGVDEGGFVFYTNYESTKGRQLAARPEGCLLFFWVELERQVRIHGRIAKVSAAESDAYFAVRPLGSRHSAWASAQSSPVPGRKFLEDALDAMEQRHGDDPPRPPHWGGYRLMPDTMEFWQGRPNRLHDRLLYKREAGDWSIGRLSP